MSLRRSVAPRGRRRALIGLRVRAGPRRRSGRAAAENGLAQIAKKTSVFLALPGALLRGCLKLGDPVRCGLQSLLLDKHGLRQHIGGVGRGANAYCASKGGVNTLTKQLALEWASRGIRVNAIAPCQFMTPGLELVMKDPQFDPKKLMDTWVANIPIGRVGQPEEIFGPVLFLASEASSMVTGTILEVDGGYLAR